MQSEGNTLDSHIEAYDQRFPHYEENRIVHVAYGQRIAQTIQKQQLRLALSLGIGHTEVTRCILDQLVSGPLQRYVVVDGSPAIIEAFRRSLGSVPPGLELLEGFFETFEYPAQFDVIEAGFVLEHVDDPELVLRRLREFLAPSGRLFLAVPNARSLHRLLGSHAGFLDDVYVLSDADRALGHKRYFDLRTLTDLAQQCGYRIVKTGGLLLKPFTTHQMNSLALPPAVWQALMAVAEDYPEISNSMYMEVTA